MIKKLEARGKTIRDSDAFKQYAAKQSPRYTKGDENEDNSAYEFDGGKGVLSRPGERNMGKRIKAMLEREGMIVSNRWINMDTTIFFHDGDGQVFQLNLYRRGDYDKGEEFAQHFPAKTESNRRGRRDLDD